MTLSFEYFGFQGRSRGYRPAVVMVTVWAQAQVDLWYDRKAFLCSWGRRGSSWCEALLAVCSRCLTGGDSGTRLGGNKKCHHDKKHSDHVSKEETEGTSTSSRVHVQVSFSRHWAAGCFVQHVNRGIISFECCRGGEAPFTCNCLMTDVLRFLQFKHS